MPTALPAQAGRLQRTLAGRAGDAKLSLTPACEGVAMQDGMTLLETYLSDLEAEMALNRLTALGVEAMVQKDNCGGMRPHLDLQGVRLLVAGPDLEKAQAILAETGEPGAQAAWLCPKCSEEIAGNFDACWQCGYQRG